jgi:enoyl-CoA hydratase/carnithine racemase
MNAPIAEQYVLTTRDQRGVATLTLNRPQQFNALSQEMMAALQTELETLANDDSVRVVVIGAQ